MATTAKRTEHAVERLDVAAYTVPTDRPESDGTLEWDSTTIVIVELAAGGERGLGYTYADASAAQLIDRRLRKIVEGADAMDVGAVWEATIGAVRNIGRPGIAASAISAVDAARWDLKARLLDLPLVRLLGAVRAAVPVYGSGGFASYTIGELGEQLGHWVAAGIPRVKMKVGRKPEEDLARVRAAREAIGPDAELFVDANGAYDRKQALAFAEAFALEGVSWFEEPVSSDDLEGLRLLRDRAPAGLEISAGEYGYDPWYFRRMLESGAVDVLQADASRCLGITGFLRAAALADAYHVPLSAHTAPSLHVHPCCALPIVRHLEWFHDHARIERLLFEGAPEPSSGELAADLSRPGLGLELRRADAERYAIQ
ncbi:MAG: enolase C-terminal domain-like protein [Gaiellaceae bacterium]